MNAPVDAAAFESVFEAPKQRDGGRAEIWAGGIITVAFFILFLGWASFFRLDAAAYAIGSVSVAGHRQSVQHKDGGIISAINVREGMHVAAGQVLISLAPAEVEAAEKAMAAQVIGLQAQRARLQAEQSHVAAIVAPDEFQQLTGDERIEADRSLALQRTEFISRRSALQGQKLVLGQRQSQLGSSIDGYDRQKVSTTEQSRLIGDELSGMQSLAAKGFASMNRVRELQRTEAALTGDIGNLDASVARSRAQIGEVRMQALSLDADRLADVAKDLRDTAYQLNDLLPKLHAIRDQLAQTQIRAPVSGKVVGLTVFTVGGVVSPGQRLLDIVPENRRIVVQGRLAPNDTDGLALGQMAELKVTAIHDRSLPTLEGRISRISADSLVDERTGVEYFTVEVSVPSSAVAEIAKLRGADGALRVGQPVQIIIPLRKRTALQYMLEPLSGAFWKSFHEQ